MAKKTSFSHIETQQTLEHIADQTSPATFGYDLLRLFCAFSPAMIQRLIDGRGNKAKDGKTLLAEKKLAYRAVGDGTSLTDALEEMQHDATISK